jgi:hypothetical protein
MKKAIDNRNTGSKPSDPPMGTREEVAPKTVKHRYHAGHGDTSGENATGESVAPRKAKRHLAY